MQAKSHRIIEVRMSYTPTVGVPFILKHFRRFQNPFLRFSTIWSNPNFETVFGGHAFGWLTALNRGRHWTSPEIQVHVKQE
jgi:hypothetical protein